MVAPRAVPGVVVAVGCGLLSLVESVQQEWCFPGESLHRWWQWWRRPRGVAFPAEGTIEGYHVLAARGPRVKPSPLWTCDDGAIGVMPFLEAPHLETRLGLWKPWWSAGGVALCVAAVVVRLVRVGREVQRAHECVASSWRAWCSGDLGDGWAEVLLSE